MRDVLLAKGYTVAYRELAGADEVLTGARSRDEEKMRQEHGPVLSCTREFVALPTALWVGPVMGLQQ